MKNRLIICEGYDGSGKSTLAEAVAKKVGCLLFHFTWTPALSGKAMEDYVNNVTTNLIQDMRRNPNTCIVLDRLPSISEKIYAPIMRPGQEANLSYSERLWMQLDPLLILCSRDNPVEFHDQNRDEAHPYGKRAFAKVVKKYEALGKEWEADMSLRDRIIRYHVNNVAPEGLDAWITEHLY